MKPRIPLSLCVLAALVPGATLVAIPAVAENIHREYHETFSVRPGMSLFLEHGDGDVEITPVDSDQLTIDILYDATHNRLGVGSRREFEAEFEETENQIRVHGRAKGSGPFIGIQSSNVHEHAYRISGPSWLLLEIRGDDGDVDIRGWSAAIDCEMDDGDITLRDVNAEVRAFTEDGDVSILGLHGNLHLESDNGDISGENLAASRVVIRTQDGDIDLELHDAPDVDWRLDADDGRIGLWIDRMISADLSIDTDDGRISVDLPEADLDVLDRERLTARLGAGLGQIRIRTTDGSVSVQELR